MESGKVPAGSSDGPAGSSVQQLKLTGTSFGRNVDRRRW